MAVFSVNICRRLDPNASWTSIGELMGSELHPTIFLPTSSTMEPEIDNLRAELDSLLERYLQALDDYGKARNDMSGLFSSVCSHQLSAAHAEYSGILLSGTGKQRIQD
jgi:hypothetical protein